MCTAGCFAQEFSTLHLHEHRSSWFRVCMPVPIQSICTSRSYTTFGSNVLVGIGGRTAAEVDSITEYHTMGIVVDYT